MRSQAVDEAGRQARAPLAGIRRSRAPRNRESCSNTNRSGPALTWRAGNGASARLFRRYAAGQAGHARVNAADDKADYRPLVGGVGKRHGDLVGWSQGEHLDQRYHPKAPVEDQIVLADVGIAPVYEFQYLARDAGDLQVLIDMGVARRDQLSYDLQPLDAADRLTFD